MTDTNPKTGIKPEEVKHFLNSSLFVVNEDDVLYRTDCYIMAFALEKKNGPEGKMTVGLRWQFCNDLEKSGFPMSSAQRAWMMLPNELALPILCSLLAHGKNNEKSDIIINEDVIIKAIKELKSQSR